MARWIIRCAEDWLEPLWDAMRKELLQREVLHADETVVQVLKENGKTAQSKSYMWVYRTGMDGLPPIVFVRLPARTQRRISKEVSGGVPWIPAYRRLCGLQPGAGYYPLRLLGPICAGSSWRPCLLHPSNLKGLLTPAQVGRD